MSLLGGFLFGIGNVMIIEFADLHPALGWYVAFCLVAVGLLLGVTELRR